MYLDLVLGYSIPYRARYWCSAKTAKLNLMVSAHVVCSVVKLKWLINHQVQLLCIDKPFPY